MGVVIHKDHPLGRDTVDIGSRPAHHPTVIGADIPHANVIAPDDEEIGTVSVRGGSACNTNAQ